MGVDAGRDGFGWWRLSSSPRSAPNQVAAGSLAAAYSCLLT